MAPAESLESCILNQVSVAVCLSDWSTTKLSVKPDSRGVSQERRPHWVRTVYWCLFQQGFCIVLSNKSKNILTIIGDQILLNSAAWNKLLTVYNEWGIVLVAADFIGCYAYVSPLVLLGNTVNPAKAQIRWAVQSTVTPPLHICGTPGFILLRDLYCVISTAWSPLRDLHCVISTAWSPLRDLHCVISTAWSPLRDLHCVISTAWSLLCDLHCVISTAWSLLCDLHCVTYLMIITCGEEAQ